MLDKQAIYHKTPKGAQAIANRQSGLSPKLRSLLIMVDGKRAYPELTALTTAAGDCEQMLSQLAQDGLIEPAGGTLPVSAVPDAPLSERVATTPAPLAAASLPEAKRFTSHLLVRHAGPHFGRVVHENRVRRQPGGICQRRQTGQRCRARYQGRFRGRTFYCADRTPYAAGLIRRVLFRWPV